MRSRGTICLLLLLLLLLLEGAASWPDVPADGKGRSKPPRGGGGRGGGGPTRRKGSSEPRSGQTELGPLDQYLGKFRLLVLAAPGPSDTSYRLMEHQLDLGSEELSCQLAVRDLLVLLLFQQGSGSGSRGKLLRFSQRGQVSEEKLEAGAAGQIVQLLALDEARFGMVLLRKSLQLYERFPYAVRLEAVLETVDQMPLRKIESMTRRSQQLKCKGGGGVRRLGPGQVHITNRGLVNRALANRSLVNRALANRSLVNSSLANRSLVNRSLVNRSLVNRSLSNRSLVNRSLVNKSLANRTLVNKSLANRSLVNRSLVNRTLVNRSLANRTLANSRLRSTSPNSQTPFKSPIVRFPGQPAPDGGSPSGRTLGKQKGSTLTANSIGERRAVTSRSPAKPRGSPASPVPPGQGTLGSLMDQIKQRVQQMLAANQGYPIQRRPARITQNGSQVPRTGPNTYHTPRVQTMGSTPVTSTMTPLNRTTAGSAQNFQPSKTAVPKWDESQFSTTQQMKGRSPARAGILRSNLSTARSQDSLRTQHTLENGSAVLTAPAHQPTESGHQDNESPTTQAARPGLWPFSNPPGRVSPTLKKATFSSVTQEESRRSASNPESIQARDQQTDSPIGNTLPKSTRVPATAQPIEGWTRAKTGGALTRTGAHLPSEAEQEGGGPSQSQETAPTVRPKGRKQERQHGENAGKGVRGKGRKNRRNRKNRKSSSRDSKQIDSRELVGFLDHFRNKRRLLLITAPSKDSELYVHQRDEYLENVCELAVRRISVITILGSLTNSTLNVEHYQTENELALETPAPESVGADLTAQLRRDYGMTFDEFFMVLVDYDMKVKQYFDVPIPMKVLVNYMDTLPSRQPEIQEEKRSGVTCVKHDSQVNINKFLSRLQWKRRLLIISTPDDEDWTFQQQITAMHGQACNLGIRHFALLKLTGSGEDASGFLELFPLNGRSQVESEELPSMVVTGLRERFQISEEHFMMLLVGKDGTINSWYLSPMWSLAIIYDLVDSMQLRQEEMRLQETLGLYCHEDEYSLHYRGYPEHG